MRVADKEKKNEQIHEQMNACKWMNVRRRRSKRNENWTPKSILAAKRGFLQLRDGLTDQKTTDQPTEPWSLTDDLLQMKMLSVPNPPLLMEICIISRNWEGVSNVVAFKFMNKFENYRQMRGLQGALKWFFCQLSIFWMELFQDEGCMISMNSITYF